MTAKQLEDIYNLIKLEDDGVAAALDRYSPVELQTALTKLGEPFKLSFTQRMMARAFSIDVPTEVNRFTRLIREVLTKKEAQQEPPAEVHIEAGFLPENLK